MDEFSIAAKLDRIKYDCRQEIVLTDDAMEKMQNLDFSNFDEIVFDDSEEQFYPPENFSNYTTEIIDMELPHSYQNEPTLEEITAPYLDITYNATNYQHCIECGKSTFDFSSGSTCLCNYEKVVLGVMYLFTIFYLIGFMMNAALVWGLSNTKITRPSNIYIVNLAAADFMIITVLPFMHTEIRSEKWDHGPFLCKMLYVVDIIFHLSSQWFLVCIAYDRYLLLKGTPTFQRVKKAKVYSASIWIIALISGFWHGCNTCLHDQWSCQNKISEVKFTPNGNGTAECYNDHPDNSNHVLFLCETEQTCRFQGWFSPCKGKSEIQKASEGQYSYTNTLTPYHDSLINQCISCLLCFILPIVTTVVIYSYIWWTIDKYREIRKRQVQQSFIDNIGEERAGDSDEENLKHEIATKHILIIMVCSFVFWMPYWISRISTSAVWNREIMSEKSMHYLTYLPMYLAYANTVANPFVYGWMNRALRRELVLNEVVQHAFVSMFELVSFFFPENVQFSKFSLHLVFLSVF